MTNKQTELFNSKLFGRANHEQGCIHSHNLKGKITSSYRKKSPLLPLTVLEDFGPTLQTVQDLGGSRRLAPSSGPGAQQAGHSHKRLLAKSGGLSTGPCICLPARSENSTKDSVHRGIDLDFNY